MDKKMKMKTFFYKEDFEKKDPVKFWVTDGKYKVNFKGLTGEKAHSGKKSFKLDVTFKEGSYFYWCIPLKVPAEGSLKFSAHLLVDKKGTGTVGLGVNPVFPTTCDKGYRPFSDSLVKKGGWQLIAGDVVKFSREIADKMTSNTAWHLTVRDIGIYMDRIVLFLTGNPGERVVVYIDDLQVSGTVPTESAYKKQISRRWALYKKRFDKKMASWERSLRRIEKEIESCGPLPKKMGGLYTETEKRITAVKEKIGAIKKREIIFRSEIMNIGAFLEASRAVPGNFKFLQAGKLQDRDFLVYVVNPVTNLKILPDDSFIPGVISDKISISACRGEYKPASFALYTFNDISDLQIKPAALKNGKNSISAGNIDVRIVKCWYQSGEENIMYEGKKVFTPELLLKDDGLIKVDNGKRENYLKLAFPGGKTRYVWISNPKKASRRQSLAIKEFPVRDSDKLLPVNIPGNTARQFWVTIHVPEDACPGEYSGELELINTHGFIRNISITLEVLPFRLENSVLTYSIYYEGKLGDGNEGSISERDKTEEQYFAEMENLKIHGVLYPQLMHEDNLERLEKVLHIREKAGLPKGPVYYMTGAGNSQDSEELAALRKKVKNLVDFFKKHGYSPMYIYGFDEARGERLRSQKASWQMVHEAGGKTFVAGYRGTFEAMGKYLDLLVWARYPKKEEAAKWHRLGHKISCYGNPQAGVEEPETYRRNFGLLLWKHNYDGAMDFAYQWAYHGNIWNDFDSFIYRNHNFTYPTVNGVIDTIQWEGFREAVTDVRYLSTLLKLLEKAGKEERSSVRKWLEKIDVEDVNLDSIRTGIIRWITRLSKEKK